MARQKSQLAHSSTQRHNGNAINVRTLLRRRDAQHDNSKLPRRDEDDLVPFADLFFDDDPDTPLEIWHAGVLRE
jgi:hypothetical protein